jgi:trimethylamine:corrinoid methyltransferase-like protein
MLETGITFDIPTLIMDDEILDYVFRMLGSFKVDADTLSVELIKNVGPFGTYLAEMDTAQRLGELSTYDIIDRNNYAMWESKDKPDIMEKAQKKGINILETHKQKNPLSAEKIKAIRDVVVEAEEELGVADFWKGKEDQRFIDNMIS